MAKRKVLPLPGVLSTPISPPHGGDQALGDGQPETGPAVAPGGRTIGLGKFLEEPGDLLRRHADAGILDPADDAEPPLGRGQAADRQPDMADLGELDGIRQQVDQDLP